MGANYDVFTLYVEVIGFAGEKLHITAHRTFLNFRTFIMVNVSRIQKHLSYLVTRNSLYKLNIVRTSLIIFFDEANKICLSKCNLIPLNASFEIV